MRQPVGTQCGWQPVKVRSFSLLPRMVELMFIVELAPLGHTGYRCGGRPWREKACFRTRTAPRHGGARRKFRAEPHRAWAISPFGLISAHSRRVTADRYGLLARLGDGMHVPARGRGLKSRVLPDRSTHIGAGFLYPYRVPEISMAR